MPGERSGFSSNSSREGGFPGRDGEDEDLDVDSDAMDSNGEGGIDRKEFMFRNSRNRRGNRQQNGVSKCHKKPQARGNARPGQSAGQQENGKCNHTALLDREGGF